MDVAGKPVPHGTYSGYTDRGCRCDSCRAANAERGRRYYAANLKRERVPRKSLLSEAERAEKRAESRRRYRQANAEKIAEYRRNYREANAEKISEYGRRWYEANAGKVAERARARAKSNPEKARERESRRAHNRRARKLNAFVEEVPRLEIFNRDGWSCQIVGCLYPGQPISLDVSCNDPLYAVMDHTIPLAASGTHERSNLQAAHSRCNLVKKDRVGGIPRSL